MGNFLYIGLNYRQGLKVTRLRMVLRGKRTSYKRLNFSFSDGVCNDVIHNVIQMKDKSFYPSFYYEVNDPSTSEVVKILLMCMSSTF